MEELLIDQKEPIGCFWFLNMATGIICPAVRATWGKQHSTTVLSEERNGKLLPSILHLDSSR